MQLKSICKCKRGEKAIARKNYKKLIEAHPKLNLIKDRIYKWNVVLNIQQSTLHQLKSVN